MIDIPTFDSAASFAAAALLSFGLGWGLGKFRSAIDRAISEA